MEEEEEKVDAVRTGALGTKRDLDASHLAFSPPTSPSPPHHREVVPLVLLCTHLFIHSS